MTGAADGQEPTAATDVQKVEFHLARQPMGQALTALGQQTGLTVIMDSSLAGDLIAPAVEGHYTAAEAVRQILAPTELHARYLDKKTVVVLAARDGTHANQSKAAGSAARESTQEPATAPAPQKTDQPARTPSSRPAKALKQSSPSGLTSAANGPDQN